MDLVLMLDDLLINFNIMGESYSIFTLCSPPSTSLPQIKANLHQKLPELSPHISIDTIHHIFPPPFIGRNSSNAYKSIVNAGSYHIENDLKPDSEAAHFCASQRKLIQEIAFAFQGL